MKMPMIFKVMTTNSRHLCILRMSTGLSAPEMSVFSCAHRDVDRSVLERYLSLPLGSGVARVRHCSGKMFSYLNHFGLISSDFSRRYTCLAMHSKWIERFSTCVDRKTKGQLLVVLWASVGSHNQRRRAEGGSSNVRTRKLCTWTLKAYWWARVGHTNPSWHQRRDERGLESDQERVWVLASILKDVSIVVCKLLECNLDKENNLLASKGNYSF